MGLTYDATDNLSYITNRHVGAFTREDGKSAVKTWNNPITAGTDDSRVFGEKVIFNANNAWTGVTG